MAERRLNKSLVVGLIIGLMVISTGAVIGLLMAYRGQEREAGPYVRMALEAYRMGNFEGAVKAYGQAFKQTRDPNWLLAQGQAAKDQRDAATALKCWGQAVTEDPGFIAAHEARVRMRLELVGLLGSSVGQGVGHSAALRDAAEALLRQKADHPLGHFGLGVALTRLEQEDPNNMTRGIAEIEKAYELAPADREIAQSLANVYEITRYNLRRENKEKEAEEFRKKAEDVYLGMIKADPESDACYLSYAEFLMKRFRSEMGTAASERKKVDPAKREALLKQIEENLQAAEKRRPDSPELGMQWARYWELVGNDEKVSAALEKTIEAVPNHLEAYMELAARRRRERKFDEAMKVLEAALARPVDRLGFLGEVNKLRRFRVLCQAAEVQLDLARANPDQREQHLKKAEEYYNQAVAERGADNAIAHQVRGEIREVQGLFKDAEEAYEAAEKGLRWELHRQEKIQLRLRLAQVYLRRQIPGKALQMLNSVLEHAPGHHGARFLRAGMYLGMGKPQEAVDDASRILADAKDLGDDNPLIRDTRLVAMEAYRQMGKIEPMKALQAKLGKGQTAGDKLREALIYEAEKDDAKAGEAFKAALKEDPANPQVLMRAIQFFMATSQPAEARKLYQAALAETPDDLNLKKLGLYLDEDFPKLDAKERDQRELALIHEIKDDFGRQFALYEFYINRNDVPQAIAHLEAARKLKPDHPALLEREFTLALQQRDWPRAERCYEQAVKLDADGAGGRFFKGRIALVKAESEKMEAGTLGTKDASKAREHEAKAKAFYVEAAKHFREGIGIYDKSSMSHYWLGVAEEGLNNLVEARDTYLTAVQLNPTNGAAHRALAKMGKTYQNVGDVDRHLKEAIRLAAKDGQGLPFDPWLRMQVEIEMEQKDPGKAIAQREEARKKNPKDIYNLMRLALVYERTNEKAKAEKCVVEALQVDPKNGGLIWDASRYYARNDQSAKAEQLIRDYVKQVEGDEKGNAQVMVARHYVGEFTRLAEKKAPTEELLKAQQAADQAYAVAVHLKAPPQVYAEAASFCLATGRAAAAVKWLRDALEVNKDPTYEAHVRRRLIRIFLSGRPVPVEAATEIADYVKRFPEDPIGLLFRGSLFAAQGKLAEAIEEHTAYLDQISRESKGPGREARLAEGYFFRGQLYLRRARTTYANRAELLRLAVRDLTRAKGSDSEEMGNVGARVALAQAYELLGQPEEAVRELQAVLTKQPKATGAARELVRLYARHKRWSDQETLLRQQMNLFPDDWYWPFVLGSQLEQRGQTAEALVPLRKASEILNYEVMQGAGPGQPVVELLRVLGKTNNYKEILEIVTRKIPKEKRLPDVQGYYAGALAKAGKTAEALQEFRSALASVRTFDEHSRIAQHVGESFGLKQAVELLRQEHAKKTDKTEVTPLLLSSLLAYDNRQADALVAGAEAVAAATDPVRKGICLTSQGMLLYDLGKKEEAAAAYGEAFRLRGGDLTVLNNLAFTLAEDLKRPKEGLPYAERAAGLAPGDPSVLDTLGWCLFLVGRTQDALGVLSEAIDQAPTLLDPRLHLAQLYAKEGRKGDAEGALRAALKIAADANDEAGKTRVTKVMKELGIQP